LWLIGGRVRRLLVLFGAVFVLLPAGSALATTIGQVGASPPYGGDCSAGQFADTTYVVPSGGGVINSFSFDSSSASAGEQRDFLVLRPSGGSNYTVVGKTGLVTMLGAGLQTVPVNIAVQSGDILGFSISGASATFHADCLREGVSGGGFISGINCSPVPCTVPDPKVGDTLSIPGPADSTEDLNESANLILNPPSIAEAFSPSQVPLNGTSTLTYTITNPSTNAATLTGVAFTDTLPSGLVVATPGFNFSACDGGTLTATAGSSSISLTGGSIPATGTCEIALHVTGTTAGDKKNSVTVSSDNGGTGNTANATLPVVAPPSIAEAFGAATVPLNGTTSLTFTITNPSANTVAESGVAFTDSLPFGVVVATPNGLSNACGGTVTADERTASISLSGGSIAASSSCEVVVNVTGVTQGNWSNSTTVSSTNGGTGNTPSANLVVAPPTVAAVAPSGGPTAGGNRVTITGANFTAGSTVKFGSSGSALPSKLVSSSALTVKAPAHAAGSVNVFVTSGGLTSAATSSDRYTFGEPVVSGVSPSGGSTAGGNTVTITGANFAAGSTVKFGSSGSALPSTFVSSSKLKVAAPAHAAGAVNVFVTTGLGTSAATSSDLYAFGKPVVSGISPTSGPTDGGTVVTITGSGFVPGATVKFGPVLPAVASTFVSGSKLTVTAPAHVAGTVNVSVTTPAGTSTHTTTDQYTYFRVQ
jgi:uncharacterized repeat protein (TIGR01451 family)